MAWSPPALERRSWLVEQAGDYATQISHHTRDGTIRHRTTPLTNTDCRRPLDPNPVTTGLNYQSPVETNAV
jgi:hypothetical protein